MTLSFVCRSKFLWNMLKSKRFSFSEELQLVHCVDLIGTSEEGVVVQSQNGKCACLGTLYHRFERIEDTHL